MAYDPNNSREALTKYRYSNAFEYQGIPGEG
jgi:hypothetical protein